MADIIRVEVLQDTTYDGIARPAGSIFEGERVYLELYIREGYVREVTDDPAPPPAPAPVHPLPARTPAARRRS